MYVCVQITLKTYRNNKHALGRIPRFVICKGNCFQTLHASSPTISWRINDIIAEINQFNHRGVSSVKLSNRTSCGIDVTSRYFIHHVVLSVWFKCCNHRKKNSCVRECRRHLLEVLVVTILKLFNRRIYHVLLYLYLSTAVGFILTKVL